MMHPIFRLLIARVLRVFAARWFSFLLVVLGPLGVEAQSTNGLSWVAINGSITIAGFDCSTNVVVIPAAIEGLPVSAIGDGTFRFCSSLTSVTIPDGVTRIGYEAFSDCTGLTSVVIPNSVTNMDDFAFYGCTNLVNLTIPNRLTSIGNYTFTYDQLTSATIPAGATSIGDYAFAYNRLTSVTIPGSVTNIGNYAFALNSLTNVTLSNGVRSIGNYAFSSEVLTTCCFRRPGTLSSVVFPSSITAIGYGAFSGLYCLPGRDCIIGNDFGTTTAFFLGDSPKGGITNSSPPRQFATVYYLPGTMGWDSTYGGAPTHAWPPMVQTSGLGFGFGTNRFGFNIAYPFEQVVVVEAATNLAKPFWVPLATNTIRSGSTYFSDPEWTNYPGRYYRLQWQ